MIFVKSKSDVNNLDKEGWVNICSKTGAGIDALLANISDSLPKQEYAISQRQYDILEKLENTLKSSCETDVDELIASDLQFAAGLVTELDGIGLSGEVLSSIFSTFCIGK
jgi:tRNA U34 5-carboxymethylaminomethyl modifying GTPase MnmE/TrmE